MQRVANLWKIFISDENIEEAIRKAIKGKRSRPCVIDFLCHKEERKKEIIKMLENGTYPKHHYRKRVIYEGKKRNIYVIDFYPWRIIHHMVINVMGPIFEKTFIDHTYGCIKGRGQHKGSMHCQKFANRFKYTLKCDIHKFYPSINQDILYSRVERKIKDEKFLRVAKEIIYSHFKGIPIGNLPSQLLGNVYLSPFDYYVKHELRFKNYIRYVDDFILCSDNKEELRELGDKIEKWLLENLKVTMSKKQLFKTKQGIDFLGYRHFNRYRLLRKKTSFRLRRNLKHLHLAYDKHKKDIDQCISTIQSYKGWIKQCNSFNFSNNLQIEEIRKSLVLKDFKKRGVTATTGTKVSGLSQEGKDIIIYAFHKKKLKTHRNKQAVKVDGIQIMFYYEEGDNQAYYFSSTSSILVKQFETITSENVPFRARVNNFKNRLYLS